MREHFSALEQAKYDVVHDYPGGAVNLAPRVGMNPGTLSNKVNPTIDTHHLSVDEAVAIQFAAEDYRILTAEAYFLNHVVIPLACYDGVSDVELLDLYAAYHAEIGETAEAIRDALADGLVTRKEFDKIRTEALQDQQAMYALLARLETLVESVDG